MNDHDLEIFTEILDKYGVTVTKDQIKYVYETFTDHLLMSSDVRFEAHKPSRSNYSTCENCKRLEAELKNKEAVSLCCKKPIQFERYNWVCTCCGKSTVKTFKD